MRKSLKTASLFAVAALFATGCTSTEGGADDQRVLQMATPVAEASVQGQSIAAWADDVEEATDGSLVIEVHASGSLLPGTDILPGVADGRADLGMSYSNYHATDLPYWGVVARPFVTSSWDIYGAAFKQLREEFPEVDEEFNDFGVMPVATITNGAATSGSSVSVTNVQELSGKRYRAPGIMAPMMQTAGVDPSFMELAEAYEGLQRGILDGFVGIDLGVATGFGLEEVAPEFTDFGIGMYASGEIFINPTVWESLTADQQEAINETQENYPSSLIPLVSDLEEQACDSILEAGGSAARVEMDSNYEEWKEKAEEAALEDLVDNAASVGISEDDYEAFMDRYVELAEELEGEIGDNYSDGFETCAAR